MKFKDILEKEVIYWQDTDCEYYWDYKYIVDLDKDNYVLINEGGSMSGYIEFSIESIDKEFVSNFMTTGDYEFPFEKKQGKLNEFIGIDDEFDDEGILYLEHDIVPIKKELVDVYINKLEEE